MSNLPARSKLSYSEPRTSRYRCGAVVDGPKPGEKTTSLAPIIDGYRTGYGASLSTYDPRQIAALTPGAIVTVTISEPLENE